MTPPARYAASACRSSFRDESHTDMMARRSTSMRSSSRRKNVLHNGRPQATGTILKDARSRRSSITRRSAALERKVRSRHRTLKRGPRLCVCAEGLRVADHLGPIINVGADGSRRLHLDRRHGQGSDTGMAQIVGEVLNVRQNPSESSPAIPTSRPSMGTLARARCLTWATP